MAYRTQVMITRALVAERWFEIMQLLVRIPLGWNGCMGIIWIADDCQITAKLNGIFLIEYDMDYFLLYFTDWNIKFFLLVWEL